MPGRLIFEKRNGKADALIREIDGQREEIPCPKQAVMPHDLFHVVVESVLQRRGFAHRYAEGEGAGFRMSHVASAEAVERLVETMQADSWSGRPPAADVIDMFRVTCAARGDTPFPLAEADIDALRSGIDAFSTRWQALALGERLVVEL